MRVHANMPTFFMFTTASSLSPFSSCAVGKLPVTIYHSSIVNQTDFLNMSMENGPGRSYKVGDNRN